MNLLDILSELPDPREDYKIKYPLTTLLFTTLCAVLCGCQSWLDVSDFCEAKKEWLKKYVNLSKGIPSCWTFRRLFILIDPVIIEQLLMATTTMLMGTNKSDQIVIDGKSLRGSRQHDARCLQTLSAWCHEHGLVLAQTAVNSTSNEAGTIPVLLDLLNLKDTTVTIDAAGCNPGIAEAIIEKKGNYVLALKKNQPKLYKAVDHYMQTEGRNKIFLKDDEFEDGHDRTVRRRYFASSPTIEELIDYKDFKDYKNYKNHKNNKWSKLNTVIAVETISRTKFAPVTSNWRYYLSSHLPDHPKLANYIRNHWSIENRLHWSLDVQMNEDNDTKSERRSTRAFATLRRIALNIVRTKDQTKKRSTRRKMLVASWKEENLMKLLV